MDSRMDEYLQVMADSINKYGWAIQGVFPVEQGDAPFAYTVGLTALGHPELAIFGLMPKLVHPVLNDLSDRIRGGKKVTPDTEDPTVLVDYPVRYVRMTSQATEDLITLAGVFYGVIPPAIQVVWPDDDRVWPWDARRPFKGHQPVHGTWGGAE